jgi:uncharacterized protein DUF5681
MEIGWVLNAFDAIPPKEFPMRFQPGQSGNPAGRPPGSLNKKTLAAEALIAERAEAIVTNLMDRAVEGHGTAMRLVSEWLVPTGRNRRFAIELPLVKTPEDAELAVSVVLDELAAGKLTIAEVSALITAIDRMLRLADRIAKMKQAEAAQAAQAEPEAPVAAAPAPRPAEKPAAPLYSPVNSQPQPTGAAAGGQGGDKPSGAARESTAPPLPRAA